ncbi:MAG: hypothetical protein BGO29_15415 [Bacteroidales bacterium 36-12]|nr:MAG: hypothetical protein BGO29_15415 [Bacteroidales bacterium 36-12]
MNKIKYILLLCFFFAANTFSQDQLKDSVRLEELVVTGSKFETSRKLVPFSVSQISSDNIRQSGHYNVLSTLSTYVPGVFITERNILGFGVSTGGSGTINIRGVGNSPNTQVLVLIDGHPQYQGIFGHPLPDAYVASDVEKVEVIRGPGSVLYGSNAMAGVINIITKKQQKDGLSATVNAVYGSYNTQKYAGTIGFKKDKFSVFASGNYDRTDGIRPNTDFNIENGYLKVGYDINHNWKAMGDVSIAHFNANDNGSVYDAPAPFNADITRGKASISIENNYSKLDGAIKLYHNFGKHDLSDGFQSSDRNSGLMIYQNYKLFENTHITGGVDAKQFGGVANKGDAANTYTTINEIAGYALVRQKLLGFLDLNAGLRFENHSIFGNEWIPMGGASAKVNETTNLKASISKGFRSPTMMELYLYAPNIELKPERMMNYEVSWMQSFISNKLNTELTAFLVEGENMIDVVPGAPPKRQNIGSFLNKGIEFSAKYRITNQLNIQANYTYLDLKKKIIAAPRHQANLNLNYQIDKLNINLSAQHVNGLYSRLETSVISPVVNNFTLLNARVSARIIKQLNIFVAVHNILNQKYEINYGYPMPGINFHGGVNVEL